MRTRVGNPYREAHGRSLRVVEWITPSWGVRPDSLGDAAATVASLVPATLRGLRVHARGPGDAVHGYLNTSLRPDGSLFVAAMFYNDDCGPECARTVMRDGKPERVLLHDGLRFLKAPLLLDGDLKTLVDAIGESREHRLGGRHDREVLRVLAFQTTREKYDLGLLTIPSASLPGCAQAECFTDGPLRAPRAA